MKELYEKYDANAPRYTSYPPTPYWKNDVDQRGWTQSLNSLERGVDIYVHIPFCESLCYYCGCYRKITKNHDVVYAYLDYLLKEYALYKKIYPGLTINRLHFGGGTPTFIPPKLLQEWLSKLQRDFAQDFLGSVEIDPRTCHDEHLKVFKEFSFNRVSLGIQDFDSEVQKAINRTQSFEMVDALVNKLRANNVDSINFDLIWGLPKQSAETIKMTIDKVKNLSPDLVSFYSYAHLPDKIPNQKLIKGEDLLYGEAKRNLYEVGKKELLDIGMSEIGMDHYAKPGSYLEMAQKEKKLKRNFMGYVDESSETLIGLGVSSISSSPLAMAQNIKDIKVYYEILDEGRFPIARSHMKTEDDILRGKIVHEIMCKNIIDKSLIQKLDLTKRLTSLCEEGLLTEQAEQYEVTTKGMTFIRYIASLFDSYYQEDLEKKFSRIV